MFGTILIIKFIEKMIGTGSTTERVSHRTVTPTQLRTGARRKLAGQEYHTTRVPPLKITPKTVTVIHPTNGTTAFDPTSTTGFTLRRY